MRAIRRGLQVVALIGTLMVGVLALTLIVSQTPWFRDWLRRYIVRESKQYLNGELSIGGLNGNLLFGVGLSDVAVDVSGQRVVAVKGLEVDYSVFQIISTGIVLNDIKVTGPTLRLIRDENGWNLARLVKEQAEEAERKGPGRPISLPSIQLTDGTVYIDDKVGSSSYRLPEQIDGLQVKASFEYAPVHYSVQLGDLRFRGTSPDLTLQQLAGGFAVREDNLYIERLTIRTGESALNVDGTVEKYLQAPVLQLSVDGNAALPELARVAPALEGYALHPAFEVKASGPTERLGLDLNVRSEAGNVRGKVTTDLKAPDLGIKGELALEALNLAPILKNPEQKSDLTGQAKVDLTMASAPEGAPAIDRLRGSFAFTGPRVAAAGYSAANVNASGSIAGPKITLDARAAAYGGSANASGFIVAPAPGRPLSFDLRGSASGVDLRNLPATTGAPKVATNLSVSQFHVKGAAGRIDGTATLRQSEVEGATIADGTSAEFATSKGNVTYAARGAVANLDLQRVGGAFKIAAFDNPESATVLNSTFDVKGSGTKADRMTLDASGTLTNSDAWGAHLPQVAYEVGMANGEISYAARGAVERLNLQRIGRAFKVPALDKPEYDSTLNSAFDVKGSGTAVAEMSLDASGTLTNSDLLGAHLPQLGYEAHLDKGALDARVDGRFEHLDPGRLSKNPKLSGSVTGSARVSARVANISAPITPDAISADGSILLEPSKVGDLAIEHAAVEGRYASQVGDLTRLSLAGPDVKVDASGRIALDRTTDSNLKYHVEAIDLAKLAGLAGQEGVAGSAVLDGTVTGNAASLQTTGTMNGSSLGYQDNSALDVNAQYTVTVPELTFAKANVKATTAATFVKVGGQEINELKATTTYANNELAFETNVKQGARDLDATGTLVLHPDHQEVHLPSLAVRTEGVEWRTAAGSEATIKYGGDRIELQDVRLVSGDQSLDARGVLALKGEQPNGALNVQVRNVDISQIEKLALQNRGLTGRVDANATITGTAAVPNVTSDVTISNGGSRPTSTIRSRRR